MEFRCQTLSVAVILCMVGCAKPATAQPAPEAAVLYQDLAPARFMRQWLVCGPFSAREEAGKPANQALRRAAFDRDFLTEHGGEAGIRPSPDVTHSSGGKTYAWRAFTSEQDRIDGDAIAGPQSDVVLYAAAEIEVATPRTVLLGIGSDDAVKVWLNGELIHENFAFRGVNIDQDLVPAPLLPGRNHLLLKVLNGDGAWGFACRALDLTPASAGRLLLAGAGDSQGKIATFLLGCGADVNARDPHGWTPLHHAAYNGRKELTELLLAKGASVNAISSEGLTPIRLARQAGFKEVAELLQSRGADPRIEPASPARQIDALLHCAPGAPGAAVLVVQDGKVRYRKGYGLADLEEKLPVRPDTPFYLASVSKQFTAMAIMILADEGKLSYEDPLHKFFPDFPSYANGATIRHLLQHTSGIPDYLNDALVQDATDFTNPKLLDLLKQQKGLEFPVGERYEYSNSGYNLSAMIVERVSGQPFHRFMEERVFRPLGMTRTRVYDESKPAIPKRARSYLPQESGFRLHDYNLLTAGDGGIFSTADDLARWDRCLYTEKLVKAATLEQAWTSGKLKDGTEFGYGFGWGVGKDRGVKMINHGGGNRGFRTQILRIPSHHFTVILLTNGGTFNPGRISQRIAEIYLGERMAPQSVATAGR